MCDAYLAFGLDRSATIEVRTGSEETELYPAIRLQFDRLEYWPFPGAKPSLPVFADQDSQAIQGPAKWIDVTELVKGKRTLFIQAKMYAEEEIMTFAKRSLGPAAAQFLRCDASRDQIPLVIQPSI
jgi:hypothetical protein